MFDFLASSPFGFWIVAVLVILIDSTILLAPEQFTFTFRSRLNVKLRIVENPYLLRHKEPIVTLITYPVAPFFITSTDEPSSGRRATKEILLNQKRIASNSAQLTNLALLSLVLVCIVGPIASLQYGIEHALVMIVPALYVSALFGAGIVWLNRSMFGFDNGAVAHILFELTICPILIVNIFRKIAVRQSRTCTADLINHFSEDQAQTIRMLKQRTEATGN